MLESVMAWILDTVREHGPLLLFLAAFLENAAFLSFILPGEKLLLVGGYLVQQGELRFEVAWLCVFAGVILGDHVGYFIGRFAGRKLMYRLPGQEAIARAETLLERYGGLAVFLGRFSGILRPIMLFTIGTMQVPYRKFWIYETIGAAAWTTLWLGMGVVGGSILDYFGISGVDAMLLLALKVVAFGIGGALLWRYRERIKGYLLGAKTPAEKAAAPAA